MTKKQFDELKKAVDKTAKLIRDNISDVNNSIDNRIHALYDKAVKIFPRALDVMKEVEMTILIIEFENGVHLTVKLPSGPNKYDGKVLFWNGQDNGLPLFGATYLNEASFRDPSKLKPNLDKYSSTLRKNNYLSLVEEVMKSPNKIYSVMRDKAIEYHQSQNQAKLEELSKLQSI